MPAYLSAATRAFLRIGWPANRSADLARRQERGDVWVYGCVGVERGRRSALGVRRSGAVVRVVLVLVLVLGGSNTHTPTHSHTHTPIHPSTSYRWILENY